MVGIKVVTQLRFSDTVDCECKCNWKKVSSWMDGWMDGWVGVDSQQFGD